MGKEVNYSVLNKGRSKNVFSLIYSEYFVKKQFYRSGWITSKPPPLVFL